MVDLSLVIPVYNERESIERTLREIQERLEEASDAIRHELIVVDDGSNDGTEEVLKDWPGIRLVTNEFNRGYGAALKAGIRRAKGEIIGITDADGTYPNRMIPDLYEKMKADGADMIVAARTRGKVKIPLVRRPAKMVLNLLANYLTGRRIPDLNSGLRLFRREHALRYFKIISDGFSFTTTLTLAMLVNDYSVIFEPIEYAARAGRSKIRPLRDTFNFLILILRTIAFFNPLKIFIPLSLLVFLMAAGCLAYQLATGNVGDLSVILLLSSLQIFLIGIIADLIVYRER
jgi:glycosyltransferase involved in cell wall biosynthesis